LRSIGLVCAAVAAKIGRSSRKGPRRAGRSLDPAARRVSVTGGWWIGLALVARGWGRRGPALGTARGPGCHSRLGGGFGNGEIAAVYSRANAARGWALRPGIWEVRELPLSFNGGKRGFRWRFEHLSRWRWAGVDSCTSGRTLASSALDRMVPVGVPMRWLWRFRKGILRRFFHTPALDDGPLLGS